MLNAIKKLRKEKYSEWITGYIFIAPIIILMTVWFYYPLINAFITSFYDANITKMNGMEFVGLANYINVLKDGEFYNSLKISFIMVIVAVPLQLIVSLVLAAVLHTIINAKTFFRTVYYLPYVTSTVAVTTIFMYLFSQGGIASKIFVKFGLPDTSWHFDVNMALPFMIILCVWTYVGFYVVAYMAGMQSIPEELYEAGTVDGANFIQRFLYITVPMLKPTTTLVLLSGTIYVLQFFDQPYAMAKGGALGSPAGATSTAVIFVYNQAFKLYHIGYGSAAAFVIFTLILIITVVQKFIIEREEA